jgi:hypothetical protein
MKLCKDCRHAVMYAMNYPTCAHPDARRDPVYGWPTEPCAFEREEKGRCGPDAIQFEGKPAEPPMPDAGSIVYMDWAELTYKRSWIARLFGW